MISKSIILLCFLYAVVAFECDPLEQIEQFPKDYNSMDSELNMMPIERHRRQVHAEGGGSPGQGVDFKVEATKNIYTSQNGRHEFDVTGQYKQHVGGNNRPQWFGGGIYRYRF